MERKQSQSCHFFFPYLGYYLLLEKGVALSDEVTHIIFTMECFLICLLCWLVGFIFYIGVGGGGG